MANILGLDKSNNRRVFVGDDPNTCNVHRVSPVTGDWNIMILPVTAMKVENYYLGMEDGLIQEVFPDLSETEREFIMTGMTSQDWDDTFADDIDVNDKGLILEDVCQHCGKPNH